MVFYSIRYKRKRNNLYSFRTVNKVKTLNINKEKKRKQHE